MRGFLAAGAYETLSSPLESSPEEESPEDEESPEEEESPDEEESPEESPEESLSEDSSSLSDDYDSGIIFVTSFLSFLSLFIRLAVYHMELTSSPASPYVSFETGTFAL